MIGPGKYDDECSFVRIETHAAGVLLLIIDGDKGSGFSVQAPLLVQVALPALLRELADNIEADTEPGGQH
jgi:hypothetical protein